MVTLGHPGVTYILNFLHSGTLALRAERQSARMSEIKNVGWTWTALNTSKCNHLTPLRFKGLMSELFNQRCDQYGSKSDARRHRRSQDRPWPIYVHLSARRRSNYREVARISREQKLSSCTSPLQTSTKCAACSLNWTRRRQTDAGDNVTLYNGQQSWQFRQTTPSHADRLQLRRIT